ncbi:hypothetical protein BW721_02910 [Jeotgalibaca sp. PTS2502]|uniref:ribonuclease HI family protein n=1 Tax=Jeotgalibaca sp. PTS2502 TaxID=1903686 RepID=UPI000973C602|nr:ribonuclease HI family protein [Jeotgalibaca sp. PTS2502]APZ48706.1 hypothetical protein BW721_02910 [Jeotgalibaca sp. PTS2502]
MIRLFIDGGSNPKKQCSSIGILLINNGRQTQIGQKLANYVDNHQAEYLALIKSLELLIENELTEQLILCHSDSKMLVDAVNKHYTSNDKYKYLLEKLLSLLQHFSNFHLKWISEKENRGAHELAKQALYSK